MTAQKAISRKDSRKHGPGGRFVGQPGLPNPGVQLSKKAALGSEYWNVGQAALATGVSDATIRMHLWKRHLRRFKFGSKTLVLKSEVLGLIKEVS
jgi:hypothetical protein